MDFCVCFSHRGSIAPQKKVGYYHTLPLQLGEDFFWDSSLKFTRLSKVNIDHLSTPVFLILIHTLIIIYIVYVYIVYVYIVYVYIVYVYNVYVYMYKVAPLDR